MERPAPPFASLVETVVARLHAAPRHCAIRFRGASISNAALLQRMHYFALQLDAVDIDAGTRVGTCLERSPDMLALLLALWSRGAVFVPLDPALPRERLYSICDIARVDFVFAHVSLEWHVDTMPCLLRLLKCADDYSSPAATPMELALHPCAPEELAYVLFTSGSSGVPKGVRITHGNLATLFAGVMPLLAPAPGARILGCANPSFDIAFFELLAPLLCGGTLILADAATCASTVQLLELIHAEQVSVVQATPSHWQLLNALPWNRSLDLAIATGEALPRDTAAAIVRRSHAAWNLYGPTECTLWSSAHRITGDDIADSAPAIVSIGSALPGYDLQLESTSTHEGGSSGELIIAGGGVGAGYCEEGASRGFERRGHRTVYHSGDMCRRDDRGLLHYTGRCDNQVKHNGYRIEPDEIALLLRQHMSIQDAACLVRPACENVPSVLFACVALRPGMPNRDKTALNGWLATALPTWMLPQRYYFLDMLPRNSNGKLDRTALLALVTSTPRLDPHGSLEARVASVFCDVLDIEDIGYCDNFLDAGGSSMQVATLVLALNEQFGSALTLRQALEMPPTVHSIVQLLRNARPARIAS